MATVTFGDPEGRTIRAIEIDGFRYPPFPGIEDRVRKLPNMKVREDDILICSYPRSGEMYMLPSNSQTSIFVKCLKI